MSPNCLNKNNYALNIEFKKEVGIDYCYKNMETGAVF